MKQDMLNQKQAIATIKNLLKKNTGKNWSVKQGGSYGYIHISPLESVIYSREDCILWGEVFQTAMFVAGATLEFSSWDTIIKKLSEWKSLS